MKSYNVTIKDVYRWDILVTANTEEEAIQKAKEKYNSDNDGWLGVADATTHEKTEFEIL